MAHTSARFSTLQIIGSKKLGGAESFFVRLHRALNESAIPSTAVTPPTSELNAALAAPLRHAPMRSVFDPFSHLALRSLIRREQPDIVQTWMGRATRLVHLAPGKGPVHVARLGGFYDPAQYRHAHALVGNTRGICDFLIREGVAANKVHFISNFVPEPRTAEPTEVNALRQGLGLPASARVIFALGRLHENKGFDTLIRAFEQLPAELDGRPLHLLIAGEGPLRADLDALVAQSEAASRIHLPGWQRDAIPSFALAELFVCPSRHEPLGNVILEAWANRVPVVSTRSDGALELIEDERSGLLVDIDQPGEMAQVMQRVLLADQVQRDALVSAGQQTLQGRFSQSVIVDAYRDLYQQLLAGKR